MTGKMLLFSCLWVIGLLTPSAVRAERIPAGVPSQEISLAELIDELASQKRWGLAHADRIKGALNTREDHGEENKQDRADIVDEDRVDLVAFTFDDGPEPQTTPLVLDALARHRVPAAFFVVTRHIVGSRAAQGLPLIARVVREGHLVGGHTANHVRLLDDDPATLEREINHSVAVLERATGTAIELFRPPYGRLGPAAARRLRTLGLTDVRWSIDPKDFHGKDGNALRRSVLHDIVEQRGGIVLLHDTKRVTASAVEQLFGDLERENCRRIAGDLPPIVPVSLHYFVRDLGKPRPIPAAVKARTRAYRSYLISRCQARARRDRPG
jgi:peptidoglycan/xylan/chitin deacetylase (PgdA/CDA1 family)